MKITLHKADTRGSSDQGWLSSHHTFSFADYSDPNRMGYGALRVINDDIVQPSMGFGTHPHKNMEIISIPITGELRHQDSMDNVQKIKAGEVQILSAGTGITHSEYNGSDVDPVNFLQIWILPKKQDIEPRYGQQLFSCDDRKNQFQEVVSPEKDSNSNAIWINQDAWFSQGDFDAGYTGTYSIKRPGNGAYFFLIEGAITVADAHLGRRDGIGIEDADSIDFAATEDCQLLIMDVPMQ